MVVGCVVGVGLERDQVWHALHHEIVVVCSNHRYIDLLKRPEPGDRRQVLVDQRHKVRAPAGEKAGRAATADVERRGDDMVVQFVCVLLRVFPRTDQALLFTIPQRETNRSPAAGQVL